MLCDACSEATGCVVDVILLAQTLLETRNSKSLLAHFCGEGLICVDTRESF